MTLTSHILQSKQTWFNLILRQDARLYALYLLHKYFMVVVAALTLHFCNQRFLTLGRNPDYILFVRFLTSLAFPP